MDSMNKTLESIVSKDQILNLSKQELGALLNEKLDFAIQSKIRSGELTFSKEKKASKSTGLDLSRFGLRNPNDVKIFLLSPAGATIIHKIAAQITSKKTREEERLHQIQEQLMLQEQKRTLLLHWLLYEKKNSQLAQKKLIEQQNKVLHKKSLSTQKKSKPQQNNSFDLIIENYHEFIKQYQEKYQILQEEEYRIINELAKLHQTHQFILDKYKLYEKNLRHVDENKLRASNILIKNTYMKLAQNKAEQTMVENQIRLLQAASTYTARAALWAMKHTTLSVNTHMKPPKEKLTTTNLVPNSFPSTSKSSTILSTTAFIKTVTDEKPKTWGKLFDIFSKLAPDVEKETEESLPEEIKKILKALKNSPEDIKKSLSQAPIPDLIMANFLKHMSYMSSHTLQPKENKLQGSNH